MSKCHELANLLDKMEIEIPSNMLEEGDDGSLYYPDHFENPEWEEMRNNAEDLCYNTIVNKAGYPKITAKLEMLHFGFHCYPGDADSFGWLIGCVSKHGRVFTFG